MLVDESGSLLGALPPFPVEVPYWQEMSDVLAAARERYALRADVLRLLTHELPTSPGGAVTYLAQAYEPVDRPLEPVDPVAAALVGIDEPLRAAYARIGGPAESLAWARDVLGRDATAEQQRTWNLSAIWRLESKRGTTWLKQVPEFFRHEAVVIEWLESAVPHLAPELIARGAEGRMLLADIAGEDFYGARLDVRLHLGELAHGLQVASIGATSDLVGAGVPDRRGGVQAAWIREHLEPWVSAHPARELLDTLEDRIDELGACGLPDTLVHGDEHPGNVRGDETRTVFLDWGDAFIGNPVFDLSGLTSRASAADTDAITAAWVGWWQRSAPGSNPARAAELARPLAALRLAAVYAHFVANIEPTERAFHLGDISDLLDRAVAR